MQMYFQLLSPLCIYFSDGVEGKTLPYVGYGSVGYILI